MDCDLHTIENSLVRRRQERQGNLSACKKQRPKRKNAQDLVRKANKEKAKSQSQKRLGNSKRLHSPNIKVIDQETAPQQQVKKKEKPVVPKEFIFKQGSNEHRILELKAHLPFDFTKCRNQRRSVTRLYRSVKLLANENALPKDKEKAKRFILSTIAEGNAMAYDNWDLNIMARNGIMFKHDPQSLRTREALAKIDFKEIARIWDELVLTNEALVATVVFKNPGIPETEKKAEINHLSMDALMPAVMLYDPKKKTQFSTHAVDMMKKDVWKEVNEKQKYKKSRKLPKPTLFRDRRNASHVNVSHSGSDKYDGASHIEAFGASMPTAKDVENEEYRLYVGGIINEAFDELKPKERKYIEIKYVTGRRDDGKKLTNDDVRELMTADFENGITTESFKKFGSRSMRRFREAMANVAERHNLSLEELEVGFAA